ncbi:MAG TPA: HAMP domain-containing sensor histidine kinase [Flavisolibacter sp.]
MPVRIRITLLFALVVFVILGIVCGSIYYFSYTSRIDTIKNRLLNRAMTTARLLSQSEIFTQQLIQRIDSSTTLTIKNKIVHAYDYQNHKIYDYSDNSGDSIHIEEEVLDDARVKESFYFKIGNKEAIAYHYADPETRIVMIVAGEDEEGKANLERLKDILLLSFWGGVIIALAGGYFFSAGLIRPVKKIADEVTEISAQNLARRIETGTTRDEWYRLSHTLNDLLNRLQESFELQRRFISNASHELSTPLTSVSSQLEVILQRERNADEYRKVLLSVLQDVKNLSRLTQTLLEFAKASGNAGGLEISTVRIDEILMRMPAEMQKQDPSFSVLLNFEQMPEDEVKLLVYGNEELLFTAIKNIVSNACKYSSDHKADIKFFIAGNHSFIHIRDRGEGIPEKEIHNIFQPFYRVEESRATPGFGLGLSLAERIIKLHKGHIRIESKKGHGSLFSIQFPIATHN